MYEQMTQSFFDLSRKTACTALKANGIAARTAGEAFDLHLAAIERSANDAANFWQAASETRDAETTATLWSKAGDMARENLENAVETNQRVLELGLKSNQEIAELVEDNFEATQAKAKKTAAKAAK